MVGNFEFVENLDKEPYKICICSLNNLNLHWHQETETILVLGGSISVTVDGRSHLLRNGELIVINSNQIHYIEHTQEENRVLILHFNLEKFHSLGIPENLYFACIGSGDTNHHIEVLRSNLVQIMLLKKSKKTGNESEIYSHLFTFFSHLSRYFSATDIKHTSLKLKEPEMNRVSKIMKYIDNNYHQKITLEEIANMVYLSPNHLTYFLKQTINMSFQEYINLVRVRQLANKITEEKDKPLDLICQNCGFSSIQYATKVFRNYYQMTPGEFKKNNLKKNASEIVTESSSMNPKYFPIYQDGDSVLLEAYISQKDLEKSKHTIDHCISLEEIKADLSGDMGTSYLSSLFNIIAIGRAYEGLRGEVQQQLITIQKEIGFSYIRFHSIFNDEMMVVNLNTNGGLTFSWHKVDTLLDFLLHIGAKPFIELTYMPNCLAEGNKVIYYWKGNISKPKNFILWRELIQQFLLHCIERYGRSEVEKWYIELWNQPDLSIFWNGSQNDYFHFYQETAFSVKQIIPNLNIGGPAISTMGVLKGEWIPNFIKYCRTNHVPLDFISFHIYPEIVPHIKEKLAQEDFTLLTWDYVDQITHLAEGQSDKIPIIISEWNITFMDGNPINDSAYAATALLKGVFSQKNYPMMIAHWMAVDSYDDKFHRDQEFHGGFGLMTYHGIRKMSYWAYWSLKQMGDTIIYSSENALITRNKEGYQLLIINHPKHTLAYDIAALQKNSLEMEQNLLLRIVLTNCTGEFIKKTYTFSKECDCVEIAEQSGLTQLLTKDEAEYISDKSRPIFRKELIESLNVLITTAQLRPYEFQLIKLIQK